MDARSAALHREAVELVNRGQLARAQRLLARADSRSDDVNLSARIRGTQAYILARRGDLATAERLCTEAYAAPGVDESTRAILAGQLGSLADHAGRLRDALTWFTRGIDGLPGDPVAQANLLINRSLVHMQLRELASARDDATRATAIFAAKGLTIDEAQSRHNEGYLALLEGDVITSLHLMSQARTTLSPLSPALAAVGDVDIAAVLRDAGVAREAEDLLERAAAVFGSHGMPPARAEAEFQLARSLLPHDPARARRVAAAAARRFARLGNTSWATRAEAVRMRAELSGGLFLRSGERSPEPRRVPKADEVAAAAKRLDRLGFRSEAAALRMTRELWAARHAVPSRAPLRVAPQASMEARLLGHEARASRAAHAGRGGDARRHAAAGLDLLAEWQAGFGSLDLQTSVTMHGNGLMLVGLESAVRSGRPDIAFEWSERARLLSQQVVPVRPPPDPALAEELEELRMLRSDDPAWLDSPRATELRERARERQWTATGSSQVQERISLDALRSTLDAETAALSYLYSAAGLVAVVATASAVRLVSLEGWADARRALPGLRADLDMSASMRAGSLADVVRRSLADRLAALSRALLDEPLRVAGDVRRVVLTVPGVLGGLPWGMLPGMRGRSFTVAVSATQWARGHAEGPRVPDSAGFVVGPRVPRGAEEVADASDTWGVALTRMGEEASVSAVTRLAHEVDVLHIAAHGRHTVDNPLFSGLELFDGTLFGYDIDLIPEVPATVVLSACEVGRSSVRWGEEAIGMTRIWLHAGSRCVIASPVIVADDDACVLLGVMHEGLARGEAPADALAAASASTGIVAPFQAHGAGF